MKFRTREIINQIPAGTMYVRLLGRHTAYNSGDPTTATPSPEGLKICGNALPVYEELTEVLVKDFGPAVVECSDVPRSFLTTWEVLRPTNLAPNHLLKMTASLTLIQNGNWFAKLKSAGKSVIEMIQEFLGKPSLQTQEFKDNAEMYGAWVRTGSARFKATFAHEVAASLCILEHLDPETAGLEECESYLICLDENRKITKVIKIRL